MPNLSIKLGQKVCSRVNTAFPMISNTKVGKMYFDMLPKHNMFNSRNITGKYFYGNRKPAVCGENLKFRIIRWFQSFIGEIDHERSWREICSGMNTFENAERVLKMLKETRLGNCTESARAAEIVLKTNGIKNACSAGLRHADRRVDHVVCVFNKDGSEFTGKIINNQTVIVDPWLGVSDLANNYFSKYRGLLGRMVDMPQKGKAWLEKIGDYTFTAEEIATLRKQYPKLDLRG